MISLLELASFEGRSGGLEDANQTNAKDDSHVLWL